MLSCGIWPGMRVLDHIRVLQGMICDAFQMCEGVHSASISESARGVLLLPVPPSLLLVRVSMWIGKYLH